MPRKCANDICPLKHKRYGWKPDLPDARDKHYKPTVLNPSDLPKSVDLSLKFKNIPVFNQGNLGSCTAHALAECYMAAEYDEHKVNPYIPSRLFIYYNERYMEGTINEDAGAMIRTGIKVLNALGAPPEKDWPYLITRFRSKPTSLSYQQALAGQVVSYERLNNRVVVQLMEVLASGLPFAFGFTVYDSFESMEVGETGSYRPDPLNEDVIGGHAVAAFGYDQVSQLFLVRNSWGSNWGNHGYFTMRFQDIMNPDMCDDFWVIRRTE